MCNTPGKPTMFNRREMIALGAVGAASLVATNRPVVADAPADVKFTLSCNMELMFPDEMPREERIQIIADEGLRAYSFWSVETDTLKKMIQAASRLGLKCGSIAASSASGWDTGLTKTGAEQIFFDEIRTNIHVAEQVGTQNLITFVGRKQRDIPWETQYKQIVNGLRTAGDLAQKHDVYIVLEPLNRVQAPQMTVLSATEGFAIIREVNHPHVKLDFDMFHLQLSEGNLINNLRQGLRKNWIRFVEVGDVPGRLEPGTGEVNYKNIFKVLREEGYGGYVGMEHGTSSTPQHAIQAVKKLAGV